MHLNLSGFFICAFPFTNITLNCSSGQGGSNGLMRTCLFGIHSAASDKMQELILLENMSKSSFSRDCQSKADAFSRSNS